MWKLIKKKAQNRRISSVVQNSASNLTFAYFLTYRRLKRRYKTFPVLCIIFCLKKETYMTNEEESLKKKSLEKERG